jgi:hypothetical protein
MDDQGPSKPQVVDVVRHVFRPVHDHARQHGGERRAADHPAFAPHHEPENLEWTVNGYVLTFAALILLGGKLGDRFGRKRIFLVGLAIFTSRPPRARVATTDTQLIAFRSLQGVGGALLNPLSLSILVSAFPRKQLPTAIGVWAGISGWAWRSDRCWVGSSTRTCPGRPCSGSTSRSVWSPPASPGGQWSSRAIPPPRRST